VSTSVKAILYAAKSTSDPKGSIDTQLEDGRQLSEHEGWQVMCEYQDEAKSAYHGSRGDGLTRAKQHAEQLAAEGYATMLVVQHSDRLARGDGVQAQHLVEMKLWADKAGVTIRSIQDPRACETILDAALMGMRNSEDSSRKGAAIKDGHTRAVTRGEWKGGILPGGYEVKRTVDGRGKVEREIVKHAEDQPFYDLIWRLAEQGISMQRISMELGLRGAMTRPLRREITRGGRMVRYEPKPFTTNRVQQILNNPFYAWMQTLNGETFEGNQPTYVGHRDVRAAQGRARRARGRRAARARSSPSGLPAVASRSVRSVWRQHAGRVART
jgi:DNA invertase Pin-like site-specific DNA recombinase